MDAYTDCYIDDCNRVYTICNTTQSPLVSESSPECTGLSSRGQTLQSNEQPSNCTVNLLPGHIMRLDCPKGECLHTAITSNTACSMDLGIDCEGEKRLLFLGSKINLILITTGSVGCSKSYILNTIIEPPTATQFHTIPTMNELLR